MIKSKLLAAAAALLICTGCAHSGGDPSGYYEEPDSAESAASQASTESLESADSSAAESKADRSDKAEEADMYDVSPIAEAYRAGDPSALSEIDRAIYEKAAAVLDEIITDGMDDYEKELAVHDYIIYNVTYDEGSLSAIPNPSEHCDDPYGALINGKAICKGYTTTFRMFMGMLRIPCGTVHSSDATGEEHAWNTVKLDGSWYYVDCTWDDPIPDSAARPVIHTYFNVSREEIETDHVLPDGCPDTESAANSYYTRSAVKIADLGEIYGAAKDALAQGRRDFVLLFDESTGITLDGVDAIDDIYEPESKALEKKLNGLAAKMKKDGLANNCFLDVRRVQTAEGIGLYVEMHLFTD